MVKQGIESAGFRLINRRRRWGVDHIDDISRIVRDPAKVETIFDVGANVGNTALEYASKFAQASVVSFEPISETYEVLKKNTRKNLRINPVLTALGNEVGSSACAIHSDSRNNSLITDLKDQLHSSPVEVRTIPVTTLDVFKSEHGIGAIDLLKIDTEGFDLAVLQGASRSLSSGEIKFVYVEFHQVVRRKSGAELGSLLEIANFLADHNYRFITAYTDSVHCDELMGTYNALFLINKHPFSWLY
jgi:FkbM family methyltransferase